jgi:hypothetical protein
MMVPDVLLDASPQVRDRADQFCAPFNVGLHQQPLLCGKHTWIPQDPRKLLVDLPYVVQESSSCDFLHLLKGEADVFRHCARKL